MFWPDSLSFLPFVILPLWAIHCLRRTLFFLYFWQLKEYRVDRFLEEIGRKKKIIFSKFFFLAIMAFVLWLILAEIAEILIFLIYLLLGLYSLLLFSKKRWIFPRFTKKIILFSAFTVASQIFLIWQFFSNFFLFIIILEILFPVFIFLCLKIIEIPVFFTKRFIKQKAKEKIEKLSGLTTIGITGSYGKTSMKEILYELLKDKYRVVKTKKHTNTEMGVAKTVIQDLSNKTEYFICEMGAYKRGEVKAICDIVRPKIGILTGINEQHLALFGSQENTIEGKYELIEALPDNGLAVFNGENKHCAELFKKTKKKKILYNLIGEIEVGKYSSSFMIGGVKFKINLPGKHNVLNILGAVKIAQELGIKLEECAKICEKLEPKSGGMPLSGRIIDSNYSSNPDGVISSLDYLNLWEGKKAIVISGLIELGSESREVHRRIEEKILEVCDIAITTTKGVFEKIDFVSSSEEILERLKEADVILVEGRAPSELMNKLLINNH